MSEDWRARIVERLRALIERAEPEVVEEAKWRKASNPDGVPTFSRDGLICTVETYRDKVKLTFAKGASLEDPSGLFNASLDAGTRRAIDLRESDELDEDAFVALVREAVSLNQSRSVDDGRLRMVQLPYPHDAGEPPIGHGCVLFGLWTYRSISTPKPPRSCSHSSSTRRPFAPTKSV